MKQIILIIVTVLLLTACNKEDEQPKPSSTTTYSCTQKNLDLYKASQDLKYAQSNLAQPTQSQRDYWIRKCDEARKKINEISAKPCI